MKALVYHGNKDIRYQETAECLEIGPQEVRLKVKFAGLCHTDFNEYLNGPLFIAQTPHVRTGRSIPIIMGHEFSGEVVEVGRDVLRVQVGDRVAVNAVDGCGHCTYCRQGKRALCSSVAYIGFARDGGFAEFSVVPEACCFQLQPEVSFQAGALVEPLAVALHAVRQAKVRRGWSAAVVGGGAVGLCVLQALKASGVDAVYVIDKIDAKAALAKRLGARSFLNAASHDPLRSIYELTKGIGVDVAFECVGSASAMETAVRVTMSGGTVCALGIFPRPFQFDWNWLVMHEKNVVTSLGYSDEFPAVIAMLAEGRLQAEPLITHTVSLAECLGQSLSRYEDIGPTNVRTLIAMEMPST